MISFINICIADCSTTSSSVLPSSSSESTICVEQDGFYPSLNDCTSYYVCTNGQPELVKCPTGLHYSVKYEVCEDPCDAKCNLSLGKKPSLLQFTFVI